LDSKASFVSKGLQKFSSAEVVLIAEFLVDYRAILKINPVIIKTALNINIFWLINLTLTLSFGRNRMIKTATLFTLSKWLLKRRLHLDLRSRHSTAFWENFLMEVPEYKLPFWSLATHQQRLLMVKLQNDITMTFGTSRIDVVCAARYLHITPIKRRIILKSLALN